MLRSRNVASTPASPGRLPALRTQIAYLCLVLVGFALPWALGFGDVSHAAVSPTMTGSIMDGDFLADLTFADGTEVGSTDFPYPVIPPGTYTVTINDAARTQSFDLSGIGVSESTGVNNLGTVTWTVTFLPCVIYTYTGGWHFQTSNSATSATACSRVDTQVTATTPTTTATTPTAVTTSGSGSGGGLSALGTPLGPAVRGTLSASVSPGGAIVLRYKRKAVVELQTGRYKLSIVDSSRTRGFALQRIGGRAVILTTSSFVGKKQVTVVLPAGSWAFFSGEARTRASPSFRVSAA
jgi:hypothetical protein